jgi:signal transduction histidine kinase
MRKKSIGNGDYDGLSQLVSVVNNADKMINDLLDADRISSGYPISLNLEESNIKMVLEEAIADLTVPSDRKIELHLEEREAKGRIDKAGMRRVIDNLITNAIKYGTPKTPITISLKSSPTAINLSVHNFGTPISPNEQKSLFEPFYRAKSVESKMKGKGWGLGLSIVNGIVKAHEGFIKVQSNYGVGTTFSIEIPNRD